MANFANSVEPKFVKLKGLRTLLVTFKAICYTEKNFSSLLTHPIWRYSPFDKYIKVSFYPALKNTISNPVLKKGLQK